MKLFQNIRLMAGAAFVIGVSIFAGIQAFSAPVNPPGPPAYGSTPALVSQYPAASTPLTAVGAGTTGAVVGTLAATANVTNYLCTFDVSVIGGTAAVGPIVVAGLIGNSFTYQMSASAAGNTMSRSFNPCIPASAVNTAITVTTTADGSATAVDVNMGGYQQ
jgi:hypothetical protein